MLCIKVVKGVTRMAAMVALAILLSSLVIKHDVRQRTGVVSYMMDECRDNEHPGVNADASYLCKWIRSDLLKRSTFSSPDCIISTTKSNENNCQDHSASFYSNYWRIFQCYQWLLEGSTRAEHYCHDGSKAWFQCPVGCHSSWSLYGANTGIDTGDTELMMWPSNGQRQ